MSESEHATSSTSRRFPGSGSLAEGVTYVEGVEYVRISGAAGRERTVTNLNQLTVDELYSALVTLCGYCTELEREVDTLRNHIQSVEGITS